MSAEDPTPHLERYATYQEACRDFRSTIPRHFNVAEAICRRHPDAVTRVGLIEVRPAARNTYTAGALDYFSDKFATVLAGSGIARGDAIAVMLAQSGALAVAHLGALKLGAVVVPLPPGTGPATSDLILKQTGARALIIGEANRGDVALEFDGRSSIKAIFVAADAIHSHIVTGGDRSFWREVYEASSDFQIADTGATTPAFIFCAHAGVGAPRYLVHSHAALIGSLAAFEMVNDFELGEGAVFWTPGAWASMEALCGVICPAFYYGIPIVAGGSMDFDGDGPLEIMEACEVTTAVLSAAQLRAWKSNHPNPRERFDLKVQRVIITDSGLTQEMIDWARTDLSVSLQSAFIDVEAGPLAATCERWFEAKAETVGRAVPGRTVETLDSEGEIVPRGTPGRIAIQLPDQSVPVDYVNDPQQTSTGPEGDWFVTGRVGIKDEDGNLLVCP